LCSFKSDRESAGFSVFAFFAVEAFLNFSYNFYGDIMKTIWLASSNAHKAEEFAAMLPGVQIKTMKDLPQQIDIVEDGTTFEENAMIKARALYNVLHEPVIADDSGLETDCLNGGPGVYSARWMGEDTSYEIKNAKLIELSENTSRKAQYVCVIAWIDEEGNESLYRGECKGEIARAPLGTNGFGYDPIFYYPPYQTTLANVSEEQKNAISHRGKALKLFLEDWGK
jgi:XTP/dITP diphosphohydrolase